MFYQIIKYLQFLIHSKTKHGIHSPFVFEIVTKCFKQKKNSESKIITKYIKELKNNHTKVNVTDFGAGSRVFKNNIRVVSAILKNVAISKKHASLLARLVTFFKSKNILEIGTSLGLGTLSLALGNENAVLTTLEGCPETVQIPKKSLKKYVPNTVQFLVGEFNTTLPSVLNDNKYDLIYFDGNHQKEPTIKYFEACLQAIHNETVFIFDDIYWSKEMTEAWSYIKNHPSVTLTIDIYDLGFVFFRKEQYEKEHFKIRL